MKHLQCSQSRICCSSIYTVSEENEQSCEIDNLKKKGWKGTELCEFCGASESLEHLLFTCPLAEYMWNVSCVSLGIYLKPSSFNDLYQGWFAASSGRDRKLLLIGTAALFWTIWKTRNRSCFHFSRIRPGDPTNVIFYLCNILNDWATLQKGVLRKVLQRGASKIAKVAHEVFCRRHGWGPDILRLCDPRE
jgi:hypothetical protein